MPLKNCPHCGKSLPRVKRAPNRYNDFVKEGMKLEAVQKLPPTDRMKAVAALWHKKKARELKAKVKAEAKSTKNQ